MSAPSLWTKHRPIARGIAVEYRIPGLDAEDAAQEALIALWDASMRYDPERGTFPSFARLVVRRRMITLLHRATTQGRSARTVELIDAEAEDPSLGRERLSEIMSQLPTLSDLERKAVRDYVRGDYDSRDKVQDNALARARKKLAAA